MKKGRVVFVILSELLLLIGCGGGSMPENKLFPKMQEVPESGWIALRNKKIYFGHQSVGFNIIDGLKDVIREQSRVRLNIVETSDQKFFGTPLFAHSRVGKNDDPLSKIRGFADLMGQGIGGRADLAFFKFCFVDITQETDIEGVFNRYRESMTRLKSEFPNTVFIHVTEPLTTVQRGPKAWVKRIIGRPIGGYAANIRRNQFNDLLRKEYAGKEPIFDLAEIESTAQDGGRSSFEQDGKLYYAMLPEYTTDGGHLNERGRGIVAEQLLILLVRLCARSN